jgi:hypothetical protein
MVPVEPIYAYERGHVQCAQLVHVARACLASGRCTNETLQELVSRVLAVNATEPMLMYPVLRAYTRYEGSGASVANRTVFTIKTPRAPSESVEVYVLAASYPYSGKYRKFWLNEERTLYNLTLQYAHWYAAPFFNLQLCPRIYDPSGLADVKPLAPCLWSVGVPGNYTLRDEYGIPVRVVVRG